MKIIWKILDKFGVAGGKRKAEIVAEEGGLGQMPTAVRESLACISEAVEAMGGFVEDFATAAENTFTDEQWGEIMRLGEIMHIIMEANNENRTGASS